MRKFLIITVVLAGLLIWGCFRDEAKNYISEIGGIPAKNTIVDKAKKDDIKDGKKPSVLPGKTETLIVYRAASDGSEALIAEKVQVAKNSKPNPEQALIALCSTKPQNEKFANVIPVGTKVLGLTIEEDGTAVANFSKELGKRGQGSYDEMMAVYAIVNTLTEYPEIKQVQILIEGKKRVVLGSHMDIEEPIKRNSTLFKK